jgi:hypothetical protein
MVGPAQQGKRPVVMALCTRDDAVASGRWQECSHGTRGGVGGGVWQCHGDGNSPARWGDVREQRWQRAAMFDNGRRVPVVGDGCGADLQLEEVTGEVRL